MAGKLFYWILGLILLAACKKDDRAGVNSNIEQITLLADYEMGYGGYYYYVYKPWIFFKNGTFIKEPVLPVDELAFETLTRNEAANWGTWKQEGNKVKITYHNGNTAEKDWPGSKAVSPGKSETLEGNFSSISGGGNLAWGGDIGILSYSRMSFTADGWYTTERISGSNSSSHAAYHTQTTSGRYSFSADYSITLTANNGQTKKLFFCWFGNQEKHFRLAGRTFSRNSN